MALQFLKLPIAPISPRCPIQTGPTGTTKEKLVDGRRSTNFPFSIFHFPFSNLSLQNETNEHHHTHCGGGGVGGADGL